MLCPERPSPGGGAVGAGVIVLLKYPDDTVVARQFRAHHPWRARLRASSLDRALADGVQSESSIALVARGQVLMSRRMRQRLAWDLLILARTSLDVRTPRERRRPVAWGAVAASYDEIDRLGRRLLAPEPVAPRGVALTRLLLRNAAGPLFCADGPDDLTAAVRQALAALEPSLTW
jgi:hypothetical protein